MAQPNDLAQIMQIQSRERLARAEKRVQAQKEAEKNKRKRPENVNRELFQLLGDLDPQMVPVEELKKAKTEEGKTKVVPKLARPVDKWIWHPFQNSARQDSLRLSHWMKEKEKEDVYPFARFNKKARMVTYTDDEYNKVIKPLKSDWDKLETDVLFDLLDRFSLRFIVIADRYSEEVRERYEKQNCVKEATSGAAMSKAGGRKRDAKAASKRSFKDRTVDELKDRYYKVAKEILELRGDTENPIVQKPFNFEMEVRRKNNLEKIFMRTRDQIEREKYCLSELKKIDQKLKKEEKEEKNLFKFIGRDIEESRMPLDLTKQNKSGRKDAQRQFQGVYLLSNRFHSKLPVSEELQLTVNAALQGMKIDVNQLHYSQGVLELLDSLKEELLVLFSLDKFINKKNEEIDELKTSIDEIDALRVVYDKAQMLREQQKQQQVQQLMQLDQRLVQAKKLQMQQQAQQMQGHDASGAQGRAGALQLQGQSSQVMSGSNGENASASADGKDGGQTGGNEPQQSSQTRQRRGQNKANRSQQPREERKNARQSKQAAAKAAEDGERGSEDKTEQSGTGKDADGKEGGAQHAPQQKRKRVPKPRQTKQQAAAGQTNQSTPNKSQDGGEAGVNPSFEGDQAAMMGAPSSIPLSAQSSVQADPNVSAADGKKSQSKEAGATDGRAGRKRNTLAKSEGAVKKSGRKANNASESRSNAAKSQPGEGNF